MGDEGETSVKRMSTTRSSSQSAQTPRPVRSLTVQTDEVSSYPSHSHSHSHGGHQGPGQGPGPGQTRGGAPVASPHHPRAGRAYVPPPASPPYQPVPAVKPEPVEGGPYDYSSSHFSMMAPPDMGPGPGPSDVPLPSAWNQQAGMPSSWER
jgi:hypothetical protein